MFEILKFPSDVPRFIQSIKDLAINYAKKAYECDLNGNEYGSHGYRMSFNVCNEILISLNLPALNFDHIKM